MRLVNESADWGVAAFLVPLNEGFTLDDVYPELPRGEGVQFDPDGIPDHVDLSLYPVGLNITLADRAQSVTSLELKPAVHYATCIPQENEGDAQFADGTPIFYVSDGGFSVELDGGAESAETAIAAGVLTFDGETCTYEGPQQFATGPLTLTSSNISEQWAMFDINLFLEDGSMEALVAHIDADRERPPLEQLGPPSFVEIKARSGFVQAGASGEVSGTLETGDYALVCFNMEGPAVGGSFQVTE